MWNEVSLPDSRVYAVAWFILSPQEWMGSGRASQSPQDGAEHVCTGQKGQEQASEGLWAELEREVEGHGRRANWCSNQNANILMAEAYVLYTLVDKSMTLSLQKNSVT